MTVFAGHIVLVGTIGGHTYALGSHQGGSREETQLLNEAVASSETSVPP